MDCIRYELMISHVVSPFVSMNPVVRYYQSGSATRVDKSACIKFTPSRRNSNRLKGDYYVSPRITEETFYQICFLNERHSRKWKNFLRLQDGVIVPCGMCWWKRSISREVLICNSPVIFLGQEFFYKFSIAGTHKKTGDPRDATPSIRDWKHAMPRTVQPMAAIDPTW